MTNAADEVCRLCGGEVDFALASRDRRRPAAPGFDYDGCRRCGALQLRRIPEDLDRFYGDDYYTAHQRPVRLARGPLAPVVRRLRRGLTRLRLAIRPPALARAISGRRYGRFDWFRRTGTRLEDPILEVGCGSGRLLSRLHAEGFRDLLGIDSALPPGLEARAERCPGLRFVRATPEDVAGEYALVMAHHSFEHMRAPRRAFAALAARVRPGGWLLLRVPVADGWAPTRYGADWAQLDAPRHLQIPTRRSIERLAAEVGLRVVHVVDDSGPFQIAGSEAAAGVDAASDGRRGRFAGRVFARGLRALEIRRRAARLRRAGRGDQAAFYLERVLDLERSLDPDGPLDPAPWSDRLT